MRLIQLSERLHACPTATAAAAMAACTSDTLKSLRAALPPGVRAIVDREGGIVVVDDTADADGLPILVEV